MYTAPKDVKIGVH